MIFREKIGGSLVWARIKRKLKVRSCLKAILSVEYLRLLNLLKCVKLGLCNFGLAGVRILLDNSL